MFEALGLLPFLLTCYTLYGSIFFHLFFPCLPLSPPLSPNPSLLPSSALASSPPNAQVVVPSEYGTAVLGGITKRNAVLQNQEDFLDAFCTIICEVPLNNMFGYSTELRTLTQGKGEFSMEYSRYCPAVGLTQQQVIEEFQDSLDNSSDAQDAKKKKKKN